MKVLSGSQMPSTHETLERKGVKINHYLASFSPAKIWLNGFTLIELLVAAAIGMITIMVAGRVVIDQMESSKKIETRERQRLEWVRVNRFITNEINLAAEVDTVPSIAEKTGCAIGTGTEKMVVRFPRHLQLPSAIYFVTSSQPGWVDNVLMRCGPSIAENGEYDSSTLSNDVLLDGLEISPTDGFSVTLSGEKKANFQITLAGKINKAYSQTEGARARVQDVFIRPSENKICPENTAINLTTGDDQFVPGNSNWAGLTQGNVIICGNGGNDLIESSDGDDLIEASNPGRNTLNGADGNDRLLGADQPDRLFGGDGDDILIGKKGDDILAGGSGTNHYVPGIDDDTSRCDRDQVVGTAENGYDVVYFEQAMSNYTLSSKCDSHICRVNRTSEGSRKVVDIFGGDLLVFEDNQKELNSGSPSTLPALPTDPCNPPLVKRQDSSSSSSGQTAGGGTEPNSSGTTGGTEPNSSGTTGGTVDLGGGTVDLEGGTVNPGFGNGNSGLENGNPGLGNGNGNSGGGKKKKD